MYRISFFGFRYLKLLVMMCFLSSCAVTRHTELPKNSQQLHSLVERVVLVSIDGLSADVLKNNITPLLQFLATHGAYSWDARTVFPSQTVPGHASMITGCSVLHHGFLWNLWVPQIRCDRVSNIFSVAHANGIATAAFVQSKRIKRLVRVGNQSDVDTFQYVLDTDRLVILAKHWMRNNRREILFLHFVGVDKAGHRYGWGSREQIAALGEIDRALSVLFAKAFVHGDARTLMVITADHGGAGHNHGTLSRADMTIPWIAYGAGIKQGYLISESMKVYDTAPTILYALGVPMSAPIEGRVVQSIFEND